MLEVFTIGCEYRGASMVEHFLSKLWWKSSSKYVEHTLKPLQFLPEEFVDKGAVHYKEVMKQLHEVLTKENVTEIRMNVYSLPGIEYYFDLAQLPNLRTRKIKIIPIWFYESPRSRADSRIYKLFFQYGGGWW